MDHETYHDFELDLDLGDFGLPPAEEVDPGEGPGPRPLPAAADPHLPWLTPAMVMVLLAFGALSLAILGTGGREGGGGGGAALAWALGGSFAALYVGLLWAGTKLFYDHRYDKR